MSKTQHTPGPWNAVIPENAEAADYISCGAYRVLDTGIGSCAISWEEHVANLKLIAAAPDMAEALKAVTNNMENDEGFTTIFPDQLKAIRAALAKAGQS